MVRESFIRGFTSTINNNLKTAGIADTAKKVVSKVKNIFTKGISESAPKTLEWGQPAPETVQETTQNKPSIIKQMFRSVFGGGPAPVNPLEYTHEVKELPFGEISKMVKGKKDSGILFTGKYEGQPINEKHIDFFKKIHGYQPHHTLKVYVPREGISVPYEEFKRTIYPNIKQTDPEHGIYEIAGQKYFNPVATITVGKGKKAVTHTVKLSNPEEVKQLHNIYKQFRAGGAMKGAPNISIRSTPEEPVGFFWGDPGKTLEELQHKGFIRQGLKGLFSLNPQERLWADMIWQAAKRGQWGDVGKTLFSTQSISPMLNIALGKAMPLYTTFELGKNIDWSNPSIKDLATLGRVGLLEPSLWTGKYPLGLLPFMAEGTVAPMVEEAVLPSKGIFGSNIRAPAANTFISENV